jgi:prepilin-type processing-associated H-X9-DG protein
VTLCPSATKLREEGARDPFVAWHHPTGRKGSYGINIWVTNPPEGRQGNMPGEWYWRSRDVSNVSNIPLLLDNRWWDFRPHHTDQPPDYEGQVDGWSTNALKYACQDRHKGKINIVFLDFAARQVGLKHLWRLKWNREFRVNAPLPVWPEWMQHYPDP